MIATLFNVFSDARGLNQFAFANADLHLRQNNALAAAAIRTPYYVLDPIPTGNGLATWLQIHQDAHSRVNVALGVAGNDLTDVDFRNEEQLASWIWLHAQEHVQAANRLGLS